MTSWLVAVIVGLGLAGPMTSIQPSNGTVATSSGPAQHVSVPATTGPMAFSPNWSGFVATARVPLTFVHARWKQPAVVCKGKFPEAAVFWVGLDGWFDGTVEQVGTEAYCYGTVPVYTAWWEMYPTNSITPMFVVNPGDLIDASVTYRSGVFKMTLTDLTLALKATVTQACQSTLTCNRSSAEWIAESPTYSGQLTNLPQWTRLGFSKGNASVRVDISKTSSIAVFPNFPVTMVGATGNRAVPSALGPLGAGFTVAWVSA